MGYFFDPNLGDINTSVLISQLSGGTQLYVNETTGSDSNPGTAAYPFKTLTAAHAAAVAASNTTIFLQGTVHLTSTLAWSKNGVNLVGLRGYSENDRARISSTGATAFSPLVNVTAQGCQFSDIGTFHGGFTGATGSQVCWAEAGGRNSYSGCQFFGGGDATTAALAGMRSLTIGGAGENVFERCVIGLDTIIRATAANASLELIAGTTRNLMRWCLFEAWCSDASDNHILIASGGMDRYLILQGCQLHNFTGGGGTALSAAIANAGGSPGGDVILTPDCISVGSTAIATTGNVYVGQISAAGATTTGIGILAT